MGWSLGNQGPEAPELLDGFFCSLGRALFIAAEYERKCHYVLGIGTLVKRVEDTTAPPLSFEDLLAVVKENVTLGATVRDLRGLRKLTNADLAVLDAGRVARNYIAHEAGALGPLWSFRTGRLGKAFESLRDNVTVLAEADNLVSTWIYCIEEKEPAPVGMQESYPSMVVAWVFGSDGQTDPTGSQT